MIQGLGEKLINLRLSHHLSQYDVAKKTGISQASICSYESGARTPSISALIVLSNFYHCSIDYLVKGNCTDDIYIINKNDIDKEKLDLLQSLLNFIEK